MSLLSMFSIMIKISKCILFIKLCIFENRIHWAIGVSPIDIQLLILMYYQTVLQQIYGVEI